MQQGYWGSLENPPGIGWAGFILHEQLRKVKLAVKNWHATHLVDIKQKEEGILRELEIIDGFAESVGLNEVELAHKSDIQTELLCLYVFLPSCFYFSALLLSTVGSFCCYFGCSFGLFMTLVCLLYFDLFFVFWIWWGCYGDVILVEKSGCIYLSYLCISFSHISWLPYYFHCIALLY